MDMEEHVPHFEPLPHLQKRARAETHERNKVKNKEGLYYFALPLQKSAIDF